MLDTAKISAIFSSVKTASEIAKLIKNSTVPLREEEIKLQMEELISMFANIEIELSEVQVMQKEKEEKILELEKILSKKDKLTLKEDMYWMENDNIPFCKDCYESNSKYNHLDSKQESTDNSVRYYCNICDNNYCI